MGCETLHLPGGGRAIVCDRSRRKPKRCKCGARAEYQCDWKMEARKSGTCDAHICATCRTPVSDDKDLCAEHAQAWQQRTATHENK